MSLKAQLAAKKAAKAERKLRQQSKAVIGAGYAHTPQEKALLAHHRRNNLIKMQRGEPMDLDGQLTIAIRDYCRLDDLIAQHNNQYINYFVQLARLATLYGAIYDDPRIRRAARNAETALIVIRDARNFPPDERKTILRPLAELIEWVRAYREIVPLPTVQKCETYSDAAQTLLNAMDYASLPAWHQDALYRIIRGQSLRSIAKEIKEQGGSMSEAELRETILTAASLAYYTLGVYCSVPQPDSIPILRSDAWRAFAEPQCLADVIDHAKAAANSFERGTGITLLNYDEFREAAVEAHLNHYV